MHRIKSFFFIISFLVGISMVCSSCQPLRKKFTRKKNEEKTEKFIPILEPVDYAESSVSIQQKYNHHYLIYRVWEKELMAGLEHGENDKRMRHSLEQLLSNLEEMEKVVPLEKKMVLTQILDQYKSANAYFDKPKALRNNDSFISDLRKYERETRKNLKPEIVFAVNTE